MIERQIIKDIKNYEPKFIGPLTLRQFGCVAIGGLVAVPLYFALSKVFILEFCLIVCTLVLAPFLICGWYKPYDIPFEKFAYNYIRSSIISPTNRKYMVNNYYENLYNEELKKNAPESNAKKKVSKKEIKKLKKQIASLGPDYQAIK